MVHEAPANLNFWLSNALYQLELIRIVALEEAAASSPTDTDFRKGPISARNPTGADLHPPPSARARRSILTATGPVLRGYEQDERACR